MLGNFRVAGITNIKIQREREKGKKIAVNIANQASLTLSVTSHPKSMELKSLDNGSVLIYVFFLHPLIDIVHPTKVLIKHAI